MSKTITAVRKKNDQQVRMYAAGGGDSSCHIPSLTNLVSCSQTPGVNSWMLSYPLCMYIWHPFYGSQHPKPQLESQPTRPPPPRS
ncbi:Uncharacterized protein HZ326_25491 [Fusarium oxysporum f. sp. albedinis]|nr:Uncharacterized protein HZ326_25491 [Fusarium oxysporum f. sp. albedinis]